MTNELNYQLCYVKEPWAYFAPNYRRVRGDKWDVSPYEYNAGEPYGKNIIKVAYDGPRMVAPCDSYFSSPYTVKDINMGKVPWLFNDHYRVTIMAGATLKDFINMLQTCNVKVYTVAKPVVFKRPKKPLTVKIDD